MDFRAHQRRNTLSELVTSLCETSGADMELPAMVTYLAARVLAFSGIPCHDTTDICVCLVTRGRQRSAQIYS